MSERYALLVGINDYPGTGDLAGCVNDAKDMAVMLYPLGYRSTMILDGDATYDAVTLTLRSIVARARYGDQILIHFSGHGSQIRDYTGEESDFMDEVWCLHDYAHGGLLTDDELHAILAERKWGVRTVVVSDSCHSGTLARLAHIPGPLPRYIPADELHALLMANDAAANVAARTFGTRAPRRLLKRPAVVLAACRDDQVAWDTTDQNGRPCGAFTAALRRAWSPGSRIAEWFQEIDLPTRQYDQEPQLTATRRQRSWSI